MEDIMKNRIEEKHQERMTEIQKQLDNTIRQNYDKLPEHIARIHVPLTANMNVRLPLAEIKENILVLLEPTITTLATTNVLNINLREDIKSEYFDSLVLPQLPNITYAIVCLTSDYILGMLMYYIKKEFIFNFIMNDIVRPNLPQALDNVRNVLLRKDTVSKQIKEADKLTDLINDIIADLMVKLDVDALQLHLQQLVEFDFKDKVSFVSSILNSSKYFVPNFLANILMSLHCNDTDIERCIQFMKQYMVTHTKESMHELFRGYLDNRISYVDLQTIVNVTLMERNSYQGVANLQVIDGLSFDEIKVANRLIAFTSTNADKSIIEASETLKNIKALIDKFHTFNTAITLSGNELIMTDSSGGTSRYNIRKDGLAKKLVDPFFIFKQSAFIKHLFINKKDRSALYQTGLTREEDEDSLLTMSRMSINNKSPEEKVRHRNSQIKKLVQEFKHNKEIMDEYNRLTTTKIEEIKYMNPTRSKTYVMNDSGRLLLTLTETEYLYRQILQGIAAQNDNVAGINSNPVDNQIRNDQQTDIQKGIDKFPFVSTTNTLSNDVSEKILKWR